VLQARQQVVQRRLGTAQFVHQRPAPVAQQQHFLAAGFAQAVRILARPVDLDGLVAVLDQRHHQPRDVSSGTRRSSSVVLPMPE
jgi:hypothetical protein